ncbi:MAG TPA: YhjD/YihY/BrkB family envelope integrity protein [Verrucomicrobiae bacterium]|nr:YhjD/YihY/BrkB family envelope integrity protein [Verrucomicrobiae bacterium]
MAKAKQTALTVWLERGRRFLEEIPVEGVSARPLVHWLRRAVQFSWLVWRGFSQNRCPVRAAALSYTTLLALIPMLAVVLSVSKNLLHDESADLVPKLMDKLVTSVAPELEFMPVDKSGENAPAHGQVVVASHAREEAVQRIQTFIDHINAGALGVVGSAFLVVVAIRLLTTIEQAFNDIWGVARGRSIWRKVVYYWTTITLGPVLLLLAMYMTGRAEFLSLVGKMQLAPWIDKLVLHLVPFVVLWVGFSLGYTLMPNTQVRAKAAIAGGVFGGTLWQLNNLLSTLYVSRVVTYSKIYGALGIIPVLLVGLYFSWLIVLLGAQVSYATQNVRSYLQQRASERIDQEGRELLGCRIVLMACQNFVRGRNPPSIVEIADRLGASPQWLNQLVHQLTEGGVLSEIASDELSLQPARPPESITVADVLRVMRTGNDFSGESADRSRGVGVMKNVLNELYDAERTSPANLNFGELVERADSASH